MTYISDEELTRLARIEDDFEQGFMRLKNLTNAISVFGSARLKPDSVEYQQAQRLGYLLANECFNVVTGGGPGIMEAANKGAFEGMPGYSVGLNIKLPEEQQSNPYQDLSLYFQYFFARKMMLVKYSQGFVFFSGGFGTLDELFETLTLMQTDKSDKFPVILFGKDYWGGLVEWIEAQLLAKGCINPKETRLFQIADSEEEVLNLLKNRGI